MERLSRKMPIFCRRESHYVISSSGRLTSFDPSENLQIQRVWANSLRAVPPVMHTLCLSKREQTAYTPTGVSRFSFLHT